MIRSDFVSLIIFVVVDSRFGVLLNDSEEQKNAYSDEEVSPVTSPLPETDAMDLLQLSFK